jgi:hypothetical protein
MGTSEALPFRNMIQEMNETSFLKTKNKGSSKAAAS